MRQFFYSILDKFILLRRDWRGVTEFLFMNHAIEKFIESSTDQECYDVVQGLLAPYGGLPVHMIAFLKDDAILPAIHKLTKQYNVGEWYLKMFEKAFRHARTIPSYS